MEALNVIDTEEVLMELKDEGSPGILRPYPPTTEVPHQLCIIMPMRL
jgi:DNA polymerase III sliding clamp (beta) subunit (PCNA family)